VGPDSAGSGRVESGNVAEQQRAALTQSPNVVGATRCCDGTCPNCGHRARTACRPAVTSVRRLTRFWNWKSAVLSALLRSPLFAPAALQGGTRAAATAGLTDVVFRVTVAGLAGAFTQHLAGIRPRWAATMAALVGVPVIAQAAEALVHFEAATPY